VGEGVRIGDSVALDGCCLTVVRIDGSRLCFEAVAETLARTSIGARKVGERLNLERALPASGRLDGHIVQGHVDGTGRVQELERHGHDVRMTIACDAELAELLVPKGSVAIDGVSLTVLDPQAGAFSVALIPHTLAVTTLADRQPGDRVNLEADVVGKYVRHYLRQLGIGSS
jgi:riboflavin synthase